MSLPAEAGMNDLADAPADVRASATTIDAHSQNARDSGNQSMSAETGVRSFDLWLAPRTLTMLALGFASGLPFFLVGNTLSFWLRDEGATLTAIGFISWVGLAYSFKFLWAPIIDRVPAPLFSFLGRRRGWIAFTQIVVGLGLIAMAIAGTRFGLASLTALAFLVAFASASQDIVVDAWRIESAATKQELGILTSASTYGYRAAILASDALILALAEHTSWSFSYALYGAAMAIGLVATFVAAEPLRADAVLEDKESQAPLSTLKGFRDAVVGPFAEFFRAHGWPAALMLSAITLYRLPDFVMGPMTNPFYHDIGLTKDLIASVRASVGLVASVLGIGLGGFAVLRMGFMRALVVGGILQGTSIAAFALLAHHAPDMRLFVSVMGFDSFSTSFAGVALVSYMSSLTSLGYTATQYALLASAYAFVGKLAKGPSGYVIDLLKGPEGLLPAYAIYFIVAGLIGIPAIVLFLLLARVHRKEAEKLALTRAGTGANPEL
jgi:PAT family beta-lactamase induction signal transducer AmpG